MTTDQVIVVLSIGDMVGESIINMNIPIVAMLAALYIIIVVFKLLDYLSAKNDRMEIILSMFTFPITILFMPLK